MHEENQARMSFFFAGSLYELARNAHERAVAQQASGELRHLDALEAIVLAAISAEAFINELSEYAHVSSIGAEPVAEIWGPEFESLEVRTKYIIVARLLGRPFDKGKAPYQDFQRLIRIRNSIVHLKLVKGQTDEAGDWSLVIPDAVRELEAKGLTAKTGDMDTWFEKLMSAKVAKWACNSVSAVTEHISTAMQTSSHKPFWWSLFPGIFPRVVEK